jgi:hypothetical protein
MTQGPDTTVQADDSIELVVEEEICAHHWLIESPNGPTSRGTCKVCGELREFKNSVQITSWESDGGHVNRIQAISSSS